MTKKPAFTWANTNLAQQAKVLEYIGGPYVELFARQHRLGWDVWGDESANTAELAV